MTTPVPWLADAHRGSPWPELEAVVLGLGISGFSAADALQQLGARVTVLGEGTGKAETERAALLEALDVTVRLGPGSTVALPPHAGLVVTSPGIPPDAEAFAVARRAGVPVWGDVELAWRLRGPGAAPWLCVTGTNGKTTATQMLAAMLHADGRRTSAAGNVGVPLCEVVMDPQPYDVLAVELSSFQLHWADSVAAEAAVVLNVAPDHLTWHGGLESYRAAKAKIYHGARLACVYNVEDEATRRMVADADVVEGCRAIGFTLGVPEVGMVGVVDGVLADRAYVQGRQREAAPLAEVADVPTGAPHNVANALAAAALARAVGVRPASVRSALRSFRLDHHRIADVATVGGVRFVDDSKATNPHAAEASLRSFGSVVWVAGGLAKGAEFDGLVEGVRDRLRGVVLMGADRASIAAALSRHAPDVPVIDVPDVETGAMERVVAAAVSLARPGDTVLLAPACASWDMFASYAERGERFVAAVHALGGR